jgi:preprotein translocase subunit SecA
MAGRGVDIKLGGNEEHLAQLEVSKLGLHPGDPDYEEHYAKVLPEIERRVDGLREQVLEAGGLFILGTERHESRRIDNQLRGRAGRQGDPGESRFFLSAQDDLVRLFAGERIYKILDRLGSTDEEGNEEPIEAGMLSKQIEKAQRKVEEQNFLLRKRVLEYDDVMNEQRRIVYAYRDEILEGKDMGGPARDEIASVLERIVEEHTPGDFVEEWDLDGMVVALHDIFPDEMDIGEIDLNALDRQELKEALGAQARELYTQRETDLGDELMRALERYLLLQIIDNRWREHLYDMDYLREGIHLRGFAQIEPIVAYKNEAFTLFQDLMHTIWSDFARMIYNVEVEIEGTNGDGGLVPQQGSSRSALEYSGGTPEDQPNVYGDPDAEGEQGPVQVQQRRVDSNEQLGRNDPCWCGSGKKFKKCHGAGV